MNHLRVAFARPLLPALALNTMSFTDPILDVVLDSLRSSLAHVPVPIFLDGFLHSIRTANIPVNSSISNVPLVSAALGDVSFRFFAIFDCFNGGVFWFVSMVAFFGLFVAFSYFKVELLKISSSL
jgi:hypothetical protein